METFLGEEVVYRPRSQEVSSVAVWGKRRTALAGERFAVKRNIPVLRLEDGFLRSLGLGCLGYPPLSLVIDRCGIYYDATAPSDLEILLECEEFSRDLLDDARMAMEALLEHGLSKYNHAPEASPLKLGHETRTRILLLDQTVGDMSVELGGGGEAFRCMLDVALANHPQASFFVKVHPDVIAGKKKGYLSESSLTQRMQIIAQDYSPLSLLRQVDIVYTVSSQMGFEALLLGKDVRCFGMPFYAGWGVTTDAQPCLRRTRKRSVVEIFAAAYLKYARYVHPVTGVQASVHDIIRILALQRKYNDINRDGAACVHFSRWKRPHAKAYLQSTSDNVRFFSSPYRAVRHAQRHGKKLVAWSSKISEDLVRQCESLQVPLVRMEDGFLRSSGLGSDYYCPYSLVLDDLGIYYDPSRQSRLECILQTYEFSADMLSRARCLREYIVRQGITKYNWSSNPVIDLPKDKLVILIPGQVDDDASVLSGCGELRTNIDLIRKVRASNDCAYIVYKPHPDVIRKNRKGSLSQNIVMDYVDAIVENVGIHHLFGIVDEVHTLTSLAGFEAMLRTVPVHVYGQPFYAGWGLTTDELPFERRSRTLALDELIAGALIVYPTYYDWVSGQFCTPEDICYRLQDPVSSRQGSLMTRCIWWMREIWKVMSSRVN